MNKQLRIAILYHFVPKTGYDAALSAQQALVDNQTDEIVDYVKTLLRKKRIAVQLVGFNPSNVSTLRSLHADLVYNLVDSKELEVPAVKRLEEFNLPFTGTGSAGIINSNDKIKSKSIFLRHSLPTPAHTIIRLHDRIDPSMIPSVYPVIVKPAYEHCSIGITNRSIATSWRQFVTIVRALRKEHKQALIAEQFIRGREFQVTVYEHDGATHALPIAEIAFTKRAKNKWNIYGFDEKWSKHKAIYKSCNFLSPPGNLPDAIDAKIKHDAIAAFYAFGMRDYARFDLRFDPEHEKWYFLEGNANAGFDPNPRDAMTASASAAEIALDRFVLMIIQNALRRYGKATHWNLT